MSSGTTDTIAALYPYDLASQARSGAHPGKTFSASGKVSYTTGAFFAFEDVSFSTVEELHDQLERIAAEGKAFVVRSRRNPKVKKFARRSVRKQEKAPAGLRHAMLRCLPLDLDRVPNTDCHDPRVDPVGAWRWLLSLLGPEFQGVRASATWSSSCCFGVPSGQAPAYLDARVWLMLDTPIGAAAAKNLMQFLGLRAKAAFSDKGIRLEKTNKSGVTRPYDVVDWKISEPQQPIYVVPPLFRDGLADPLPVRSALLGGERGEVCYGDLQTAMRAEQPELAAQTDIADIADVDDDGLTVRETKRAPARARKAPRTKSGRVRVPGKVIPMAASARLVAAQREALDEAIRGTGTEAYRTACRHLYHRRVALEQVALAVHRGGLSEGTRDEGCTRIAAALVASLPLGWAVDRVRGEIRQLLALVVDEEWLDVEWVKARADTSIVDRYRRASEGQTAAHGRDLRYGYSKARLVEEWQPTYEEILELGLRSLCSDADRSAVERDAARSAAGGQDREDFLAAARAGAPEVHRLRGKGMSLRRIVAATGLSVSKVNRLLTLSASDVAEVEKAAMVEDVPAPVVEMVVSEVVPVGKDVLAGAIRHAMASTGAEFPEEVADALREPLDVVEWAMVRMGLWAVPELLAA